MQVAWRHGADPSISAVKILHNMIVLRPSEIDDAGVSHTVLRFYFNSVIPR